MKQHSFDKFINTEKNSKKKEEKRQEKRKWKEEKIKKFEEKNAKPEIKRFKSETVNPKFKTFDKIKNSGFTNKKAAVYPTRVFCPFFMKRLYFVVIINL